MDRGIVFTFLTVVLTFWLVKQSLQQDLFEQNTKPGENKHPGNSKTVVVTLAGLGLGFVLVLLAVIVFYLIKRCRRRELPCFKGGHVQGTESKENRNTSVKCRWQNNNHSRLLVDYPQVDSDNQSTEDDPVEVVIGLDTLWV